MDADGKDNPGLLLTNKKKIVTFDNRANLLVGYQAILDSENPGDTNSLLVLSGIYTAFGAAEKFTGTNVGQKFGLSGNGPATFTDEDLEKLLATPGGQMGTTAFNGGLNLVMVNSQTEANAQLTAPNRAAYGIFINEGGLVDIKGGNSNIILIN